MDTSSSDYQKITKELYSKNVELVNTNKILELLQKLYQIIISSDSVEIVSEQFISVIATQLGFSDGIVAIREEGNNHLRIAAITQSELNKTIIDLVGIPVSEIKFPLARRQNALVDVYLSGKGKVVENVIDVWNPAISNEDTKVISDFISSRQGLVYPIVYGDKVYASFALLTEKNVPLTEFSQNALSRLETLFGIAIDKITTSQKLKKSQASELAKAKELLKLKDEFVFIATHDLRTPVTAIDGYISLIEEEETKFSPDIEKNFEAVKEASERLKQLINDLLQVARQEAGTIKVDVAPLDMNELVARIVREVTPAADQKKVKLNTNLDQNTKMVVADDEKLYEVIENLMSNAIKFNKPEGIVTISTTPEAGALKVTVADTGAGIPKAEQSKVFQKFFKYRDDSTSSVPGTGLGLFVVRMLVEKMGGKISFTSEEGKGTTFTFTLPLAK